MAEFDFLRVMHLAQLYPEQTRVYPLGAKDPETGKPNLQGLARKNAKRDAYAQVSIEDEWVKKLQSPREEDHPLVFLVYIPRELVERADSPLILPGEVGR